MFSSKFMLYDKCDDWGLLNFLIPQLARAPSEGNQIQ